MEYLCCKMEKCQNKENRFLINSKCSRQFYTGLSSSEYWRIGSPFVFISPTFLLRRVPKESPFEGVGVTRRDSSSAASDWAVAYAVTSFLPSITVLPSFSSSRGHLPRQQQQFFHIMEAHDANNNAIHPTKPKRLAFNAAASPLLT